MIHALRAHDIKTAVVSSSKNCAAVLEAARIADLFDTRVDGLELARSGFSGEPAPDMSVMPRVPGRVLLRSLAAGLGRGRSCAQTVRVALQILRRSMRAGADEPGSRSQPLAYAMLY